MRLTSAVLCNYAEVRDGLLMIVAGGINRLWRPELPGPIGCFLALTIEVPIGEINFPHEVQIEVNAPGGTSIASIRGGFQLAAPDLEPDEVAIASIPFDLRTVGVAAAGRYEIVITLDSDPAGVLAFRVIHRPPPGLTGAPAPQGRPN